MRDREACLVTLSRRVAAVMAAILLSLPLSAVVSAAEPPAGVLLDGTVTASVARGDGSGPLAGAEVRLTARLDDFPDQMLQELTATADASGIATFSGVARPDTGGPVVHLSLQASLTTSSVDANGCTVSESWLGQTVDVVAAATVAVAIDAFPASSVSCPPSPSPSPNAAARPSNRPAPSRAAAVAATARPGTTPPATDALGDEPTNGAMPAMVVALGALLLVIGAAATTRPHGAAHRRRWQAHPRRRD